MGKRPFKLPGTVAMIVGCLCPAHTALAGGSLLPLPLPPVREIGIGAVPGALLLALGGIICLLAGWFIWSGGRGGSAGSWRAAWESARVECVAQLKWLAPLWLPVAAGLACLFGVPGEPLDPLTRRPASGPWAIAGCAVLGLLAGVLVAIAAAWCRARAAAPGEATTALSDLFLMMTLLLVLPQSVTGPCLIGFATGRALGAAAMGSTGWGGFLIVTLMVLLSRLLVFKPAIAATLIVWLFAVRLVMVLAPFGARRLLGHLNRRPVGDAGHRPLRWMTTLVSIPGIALAGWLMFGNSPGGGAQGYPGMWWMLTMLVGGGLLAGALISELMERCPKLFPAPGVDAGLSPSIWNAVVGLALLYFACDVSLQPAMARLMPPEIATAGAFFAFGLVGLGFLAGAPQSPTGDDRGSVANVGGGVSVLTLVFVIALLTQSPAGSGKPFVNLSLMYPEVLLGLMLGGAVGHWLAGALHGGRTVLAAVACFAVALALFSPESFVACLVAMTMGALMRGGNPIERGMPSVLKLFAVIQWTALAGFLAVWLATLMKHASDKTRLGWVFLAVAVVLAWQVVCGKRGRTGTTG